MEGTAQKAAAKAKSARGRWGTAGRKSTNAKKAAASNRAVCLTQAAAPKQKPAATRRRIGWRVRPSTAEHPASMPKVVKGAISSSAGEKVPPSVKVEAMYKSAAAPPQNSPKRRRPKR